MNSKIQKKFQKERKIYVRNITVFGEISKVKKNHNIMGYYSEGDDFVQYRIIFFIFIFILFLFVLHQMTKCFLENMIQRKTGHIVTISSLQGIYAFPFSVVYCATKFGCFGFMAALKEFLRWKKLDDFISTTTILPDVIGTRNDIIDIVSPR